jgi:hypothetical protein
VSAPDFSTTPRGRPRARDLALVAVALGLVFLSLRAAIAAHSERERAGARVAEVQADIEASKARLRMLEVRGGEGPLGQALLTTDAPFSRVLAELSQTLPPDARVERISLAYGRELALEMGVVARDPRAFDRLLERLDSSPRLRDVRPGPENREGEVRTTVRAVWTAHP